MLSRRCLGVHGWFVVNSRTQAEPTIEATSGVLRMVRSVHSHEIYACMAAESRRERNPPSYARLCHDALPSAARSSPAQAGQPRERRGGKAGLSAEWRREARATPAAASRRYAAARQVVACSAAPWPPSARSVWHGANRAAVAAQWGRQRRMEGHRLLRLRERLIKSVLPVNAVNSVLISSPTPHACPHKTEAPQAVQRTKERRQQPGLQ